MKKKIVLIKCPVDWGKLPDYTREEKNLFSDCDNSKIIQNISYSILFLKVLFSNKLFVSFSGIIKQSQC
jgi:hypothetical protein